MRPEDVYSAEYLRFALRPRDVGLVTSPRNRFNAGQDVEADQLFGSIIDGHNPLRTAGLEVLSTKSLTGDAVRVRIDENTGWAAVRRAAIGLPVEPSIWLDTLWLQNMVLSVDATLDLLRPGIRKVTVSVKTPGGEPIADAKVVAVYDAIKSTGVEVRTDASGKASIALPASWTKFESLAVIPRHSFWSHGQRDWTPGEAQLVEIVLPPIDAAQTSPHHHYAQASAGTGAGVKVAVIDAGIGPHADLDVAGGQNLAVKEDPADSGRHTDNGLGHGTHVAGIIAGKGRLNEARRGLAPDVKLYSYRVCAKGMREAPDAAIGAAIEEALQDNCDIINISMGYKTASSHLSTRIRQAFANGAIVVAAAGNGGRTAVSFPAATVGVVGVSAVGRRGTVQQGSFSELALGKPTGTDPNDCLAAFTNIGEELMATGPGVGIISCHPNDLYSAEDGTSMAAPYVTAITAQKLSLDAALLASDRNQLRADRIRELAINGARRLGFEPVNVGLGMP